jgi:hypothetical protein
LNLIIDDSNKIYVNEENITPKYSQRSNKKVTKKQYDLDLKVKVKYP